MIGAELCRQLVARGETPIRLSHRRHHDPSGFREVTAVVNLAGAPIGGRRWNPAYRKEIRDSRVLGTLALTKAIEDSGRDIRLISASAVGYYGDRGNELLTESSPPGDGFLSEVCQEWEEAAGPKAAIIRTGIVLSTTGGALARQLPLFKIGLGGPLGGGKQFWPWITLADQVRAILHLLDHPEISGPVNLTAPDPLPQRDFAKALGKALRRPALLPAPGFALRLLLGSFAEELLGGQRTSPKRIQDAGFEFRHPEIGVALERLLR